MAFGAGAFADNLMQNCIGNMANQVYNISLGVPPHLVSIALSIPRLWDALIDPAIGNFSDNCRSSRGRRFPFIIGGAISAGLVFITIWLVPTGWSSWAYFWYLLGMLFLFSTGYASFSVPYVAIGLEITSDYHERTRIFAIRAFFGALSGIGVQWMFWLTQRPVFGDTLQGMYVVGAGMGVIMIALGVMPALFIPDRMSKLTLRQTHQGLGRSLREAISVAAFRQILYALVAMVFGLFMVNSLGLYINIYHVFGGDIKAASVLTGLTGTAYQVTSIAALPLITHLSRRLGKRRTLIICLILPLIGTLAKWVCFTPAHPYLQLVPYILMAPGIACLWTLLGSMLADVCDLDEHTFGVRREGTFGAVYFWAHKIGLSLAVFLSGYVLVWAGFDATIGRVQSVHTILVLRVIFTLLPAIAIALTILFVSRFPITERSAYEIRKALEKRRGMIGP
jgi:glycoside/pentoside/hexuronide:cation symporter, GPH family